MINAYNKIYRNNETLLDQWRKIGILQYAKTQQNMLHILFKDESIKRCVTNMKSSLLLYLYSTACSANVFDEVRISLMVDSDEISRQYHNAASKIDLLLMKDIVPVFVKCTVNTPTRQDLEGLYMQARKFGGRLSKMVNSKGYNYAEMTGDACIGCSACAMVCPDSVITVYRVKI